MIKILDHRKTLATLVNDTTNGIGNIQPVSATVTEELNGIFEAEFTVLDSDKHFGDLHTDQPLLIQTGENNWQIFRIYFISKPINNAVTVRCQHITYDLAKTPVSPFTATGAVSTKNNMLSHVIGTTPFTMTTNITNTTSVFTLDIPRSFRECLGGYEGSILDVFRGEYEWDNLTVKMLARRGSDNGVRISYGKNLTDLVQEENIQNVYTGVLGYATLDDTVYVGNVYDKIVYDYSKILIVDFSDKYDADHLPTTSSLTSDAQSYATDNDIEVPDVNLTISYVPLYQTEEYKNIAPLERVSLGDTVHVYFDKLGVEASARVIKTVWNVNLNRYDSVELGSTKANLTSVINSTVNTAVSDAVENIDIDTGAIETELNEMSKLIINGLGLYLTKQELPSGGFRYILHNQPELADSDTQYYMSAGGIMVSNDYGQTWVTGYDPQTGTLSTQALSTIVLRALEIYGSFLRFGDTSSNYIDVAPYSNSSNVPQGVSFDGSGSIQMQPQGEFRMNNLAVSGANPKYYNRIVATKNGSNTQNVTYLENYDDSKSNYPLANYISLRAHRKTTDSDTNIVTIENNLVLQNQATITNTAYTANYLQFITRAIGTTASVDPTDTTANSIAMMNYQPRGSLSVTRQANYFLMSSNTTSTGLYLYNYSLAASGDTQNYLGNQIWFTASSNYNASYFINYKYKQVSNNSQLYANEFYLQSYLSTHSSKKNEIGMKNYNYAANSIANNVYSQSYASTNNIFLTNNLYGTTNQGNAISMSSTSAIGTMTLDNGYYSGVSQNRIILTGTNAATTSSTVVNSIQMVNLFVKKTTVANRLTIKATQTTPSVSLVNFDTSSNEINYLKMNVPDEDTGTSNLETRLYAAGDLKLYSKYAVRLKANYGQSNSQDIWLEGTSIHITYTNNIRIHLGSTTYTLSFSGGYVRYS